MGKNTEIKTGTDLIPFDPPPYIVRVIPRDTEGRVCFENGIAEAQAEIEAAGGTIIEKPDDLGNGYFGVYGVQKLIGESAPRQMERGVIFTADEKRVILQLCASISQPAVDPQTLQVIPHALSTLATVCGIAQKLNAQERSD